MDISIFKEAQHVWRGLTMQGVINTADIDAELHTKLLNFFHVGPYYFYLFDARKGDFSFMSPTVKQVLGYPADDMSVAYFLELIHPDDMATFLNNEGEIVSFLKTLPNEKIPKYKFSYDYRVRTTGGTYIRILQQVITIQYDSADDILITMGVHTDISAVKTDNRSVLSFIGLEGEPSYIDVRAKKTYQPKKSLLTKREKEIVRSIIAGEKTSEIADKLSLSPHTVNSHRKNILSKTNTRNSMELALKVISDGLI